MSTDSENVGSRLKRFAEVKYGSVNALAEELGTYGGSLRSNYISGRSIPGGKMLVALAALGCDPMWLLTGTGNPPDMNEAEMKRYIEWMEQELSRVKERLYLYLEVKRQFIRQAEADGLDVSDESLPAEYRVTRKRRTKK